MDWVMKGNERLGNLELHLGISSNQTWQLVMHVQMQSTGLFLFSSDQCEIMGKGYRAMEPFTDYLPTIVLLMGLTALRERWKVSYLSFYEPFMFNLSALNCEETLIAEEECHL